MQKNQKEKKKKMAPLSLFKLVPPLQGNKLYFD
jgi:hypothetical protein